MRRRRGIPRNSTRMGVEHSRRPIPAIAIVQALYFHFRMRTTEIARLVNWKPQEVSRETVGEYSKQIPWELRTRKAEAIRAAEVVRGHVGRCGSDEP